MCDGHLDFIKECQTWTCSNFIKVCRLLFSCFKWTQLYYKNHNLGGRSTRDLLSGRNFKPLSLSLSRWSTRDLFGGRSFKPLSLSPSPWLPPSHNKKSQFFINWGTSEVKERENILKENIFFCDCIINFFKINYN